MPLLKNPYPLPTSDDDKDASRFQSYISAEDKALLSSLRPVKGTAQAIVNHLINNICHDLRDLGINFYRPDADDILPSSSSGDHSQTSKSLVSDAPLLALLRQFQVGFANIEEGQSFVKKLQTLRLSPATFTSLLQKESNEIERTRPERLRVKRGKKPPMTAQSVLDSLI